MMNFSEISNKRNDKILKYIHRVDTDLDPVSIQAGITDFCFNKCHMCNHHKRKDKTYLSAKKWISFLKMRKDVESVCYSGGDMIGHPEINEIMQFHVDSDKAFGFITAGFIPESVNLELLRKAAWVRVSLDTVDPYIYSKARGGIDLSAVLNSIKIAKDFGVNIELTVTTSSLTKNNLPDLFNYARTNNLNIDIHPIWGESFDFLGITEILIEEIKAFDRLGLICAPHKFKSLEFNKCKAVYYQIFIDSKGDIYPCCTASGDTEQKPYMEPLGNISYWADFLINRNKFSDKIENKPEICKNCIDRFSKINYIVENYNHKNNFF